MTSPNQERTLTSTLASEISLALLHHFVKQDSVVLGARVFTDLANIQHVRLTNVEANDVQHSLRGRNFARLAHCDNIVSVAIYMTTSGIAGV
jgi:hypothetical protein